METSEQLQKQLDSLITDQANDIIRRDTISGLIEIRQKVIDLLISNMAMAKKLEKLNIEKAS